MSQGNHDWGMTMFRKKGGKHMTGPKSTVIIARKNQQKPANRILGTFVNEWG